MLKAIAFDFDGVLAESVHVKTKAFQILFADQVPATLERIVAYHLENGGISRFEKFKYIYSQILQKELTESHFQTLCIRFAELVENEVVASPWVEGAREFLTQHRSQYKYFIISGTPEKELQSIVQRRKMESLFDEILGAPRTKPELLEYVLTRHHLDVSQTVFVGDAPSDWEAAREAHVRFIWRQSPEGVPPSNDFEGPCIRSLRELGACLETSISAHE